MMFRKEPFFYGHDNYDQLVKIAKVGSVALRVLCCMLRSVIILNCYSGVFCDPMHDDKSFVVPLRVMPHCP